MNQRPRLRPRLILSPRLRLRLNYIFTTGIDDSASFVPHANNNIVYRTNTNRIFPSIMI